MQDIIKWSDNRKPVFHTGDKVYVAYTIVGQAKVSETMVRTVPIDIFHDQETGTIAIWRGWYDLTIFTFPGNHLPPTWCQKKYVFSTKKEAAKAAKWHSVTLSVEEWLVAIGDRKLKEGVVGNIEDGCELVIGCVNDGTSEIRSWLYEVEHNKGCMEVDRQEIQALINRCDNRPKALDNPKSVLRKLFKQLKLTWK